MLPIIKSYLANHSINSGAITHLCICLRFRAVLFLLVLLLGGAFHRNISARAQFALIRKKTTITKSTYDGRSVYTYFFRIFVSRRCLAFNDLFFDFLFAETKSRSLSQFAVFFASVIRFIHKGGISGSNANSILQIWIMRKYSDIMRLPVIPKVSQTYLF